jgi:hypothetical protein
MINSFWPFHTTSACLDNGTAQVVTEVESTLHEAMQQLEKKMHEIVKGNQWLYICSGYQLFRCLMQHCCI